uniref:Uncharacterized protein n=1 Tax=Anguilla anguilla TaxID=7936 RepID=A0A0E9W6R7_ANGAN
MVIIFIFKPIAFDKGAFLDVALTKYDFFLTLQ